MEQKLKGLKKLLEFNKKMNKKYEPYETLVSDLDIPNSSTWSRRGLASSMAEEIPSPSGARLGLAPSMAEETPSPSGASLGPLVQSNAFKNDLSSSTIGLKQKSSSKKRSDFTQSSTILSKSLPVSTKQWMNSIYSFNKNYTKNLPTVDDVVRKTIRDFLSFRPLALNPMGKKSRLIVRRFRRLSLNRIFVSKPEIKHSNTRAFITVYLFNKNKISLLRKVKHIYKEISYTGRASKNTSSKLYMSRLTSLYAASKKYRTQINKYVADLLQSKAPVALNSLKNTKVEALFHRKEKIDHPGTHTASTRVMCEMNSNRAKENRITVVRFSALLLKWKKGFVSSGNTSPVTEKELLRDISTFCLDLKALKGERPTSKWKKYGWVNNKVMYNNWKISGNNRIGYSIITNEQAVIDKLYKEYKKLCEKNTQRVECRKAVTSLWPYGIEETSKVDSKLPLLMDRKPNHVEALLKRARKINKSTVLPLVTKKQSNREIRNLDSIVLVKRIRKMNNFIKKYEDVNGIANIVSFNKDRLPFRLSKRVEDSISTVNGRAFKNTVDNNLVDLNNLASMYKVNFLTDIAEKELLYLYYTKMLCYNNEKYTTWFLVGLKNILSRIYNKKVNIHLVSLKYIHLNSDIFLQAITTKLRDFRKHRINKVLRKALILVPVSKVNLYNYDRLSPINKFIESYYNRFTSLGSDIFKQEVGKLNEFTLNKSLSSKDSSSTKQDQYDLPLVNGLYDKKYAHQSHTISFIRHKYVFGVRFEAGGRLTKRTTASRAVFKIRSKGNLKYNTMISRKDTSSIIGNHRISHLQFTKISSKNRNGSFGIKGWLNNN